MKVRLQGKTATTAIVDEELIRRQRAGFLIAAGRVQVREKDRSFIALALSSAQAAIDSGAEPGDFGWSRSDRDFEWILADNTTVPMDAHTVVELASQALSYISALALAASDLKSRIRSGEEIFNAGRDDLWPSSGPFSTKTGEDHVSN